MKNKKLFKLIILIFISVLVEATIIYLNTYYVASSVNKYLKNTKEVKVVKEKNGVLFDGPGEKNILVFYPGAKVEYKAYSKLMNDLAKSGLDTYIVEMPFNIAFFNPYAINNIKERYEYSNWFIGGHSLGGVVAALNTEKNDIKGLILLASYPTIKPNCKTLSIYGSNDGVLNLDKYKSSTSELKDFTEIIIDGGNHANFGVYGEQNGDLKATISRNSQQNITKNEILKFVEISS